MFIFIRLRDDFIDLWRQKNRESELRNVVAVFNAVIEKIAVWNSVDGIGGHKNPNE